MGETPWKFKDCGDDCPVERVSWEKAQQFIEKLNGLEETKAYRLPSEAEWEYACRAGSETHFFFGDDAERLGDYAWFFRNAGGKPHSVREKKPNTWGIYDMHGNVWEWVEDDWHGSYERAPDDGRAWIDNPRGSHRVYRGGSWTSKAQGCRSAQRMGKETEYFSDCLGFRLTRSVTLGP